MIPENRGGANGGPQYSPTNINPLGGNGQSGMNTDYTGFAYGENKAVNEQRKSAPIKEVPRGAAPEEVMVPNPQRPVRDLFSESLNDAEPVTDGAPTGPGRNELALPPVFRSDARSLENKQIAKKYLPFLVMGTQIAGAPDSYKQFVSYVEGMLWE